MSPPPPPATPQLWFKAGAVTDCFLKVNETIFMDSLPPCRHTCPIYDVRLSKNGTHFVTSCNDGTSMIAPCKAADLRKAGRKVRKLVDANDAVIRSEFVKYGFNLSLLAPPTAT